MHVCQESADSSKPSESPLFYTFLSSDDADNNSSTISDPGACAFDVGKETFEQAMKKLAINELNDESISLQKHPFGFSDKPMKTFCAVRGLFVCKVSHYEPVVHFNVRLDVIKGDLPILIVLPSLLAMKAALSL